jgi:glutamate synthase domain-containing protein 1
MTRAGAATAIQWAILTVAALIAAALVLHAVWERADRRLRNRIEQERVERQDRYAARAMADAMTAARLRHPTTARMTGPEAWQKPRAMPRDEVDRLMYDAEIHDLFRRDIAKLRDVDE